MKKITAQEFRDVGYLAEVNRQFLHPLGLAMFVDPEANTFGVLDDRDDPEGWYMGNVDVDLIAKRDNVARLLAERTAARVAALGYIVQPLATQGDEGIMKDRQGPPKADTDWLRRYDDDTDVQAAVARLDYLEAQQQELAALLHHCRKQLGTMDHSDLLNEHEADAYRHVALVLEHLGVAMNAR